MIQLSKYHHPCVTRVQEDCFPCLAPAFLPLLVDGMAGQVSPEALLSRLQAEGGKTEEESEVRTSTLGHPLTSVTFSLSVYVETGFSTPEKGFQSGAFPKPPFPCKRMGLFKLVKAVKMSECQHIDTFAHF